MLRPARQREPRSPRAMLIGSAAIIAAIVGTGALVAQRTRRDARAEELQILQGARKVCKLATVEIALADYAKKTVPKTIDLPFTKQATAFLFYAGTVSAGFDVCDDAAALAVDHAMREVRITLPPARILSIDISRFEIINEDEGFVNRIASDDRNRWYAEARASLERGALAQGALERAEAHARELFESFIQRHGYTLLFTIRKHAAATAEGRSAR